MDKWKILGIDKTKDRDVIKEAYRSRLVYVNPEDDSDGFMELRSAYEEAIRESEADENLSADKPDENSLVYALTNLYEDFKRRIDVEEWRRIFERDEFVALDTSDASMHTFLSFLMEHYFVPHTVFRLIMETFNINEIKRELLETYPEGFIEHIVSNAKYNDVINYALFETDDSDIDAFINMYYKLHAALQRGDVEEEQRCIDSLEKYGIYHPYFEISKLRHAFHKINDTVGSQDERNSRYADALKEMQSRAEEIFDKYRDEVCIMLACGDFAMARADYDGAGKYYEMAHKADPADYAARGRMGDYYYAIGEYEQSRDIFLQLLEENSYDAGAHSRMVRANQGLIEKLKQEISEKPEDGSLKLQLAWCYYRNALFGEATEVLESFTPADDSICQYWDLLGRNYMYEEQYEKALDCFFVWLDEIKRAVAQDGDEKEIRERLHYARANHFIADCYLRTEQYDEARKYLEEALSEGRDFFVYSHEMLCRLEYECGNYEVCVRACETLLEQGDNYDAYIYKAKSLDMLEEYSGVIKTCEHAIAMYPYGGTPYALELGVYWEFDYYDDMRNVIARFDALGCTSDRIDVYRARLSAHEEDYASSNELLLRICAKKGTGDTDIEDYFEIYALLGANYEDIGEDEQALCYYREALQEVPENLWVLNRIAGLYHIMGRFDEAIVIYDKMLVLTDDVWYRRRAYCGKAAALSCMREYGRAKEVYEVCEEELGVKERYVIDHAELLVRMDDLRGCARLIKRAVCEMGYAALAKDYMDNIPDDTEKEYEVSEEEREKHASLVQACLGNLCCFYGNEGYIEEAYRIFQMAAAKDGTDCNIYRSMGLVYLDHGMYEESKHLFEQAMKLDTEEDTFICGAYLFAVSRTDDVSKPEYQKYVAFAAAQLAGIDDEYEHFKSAKTAEFYRATGKYDEALLAVCKAIGSKRERLSCFVGYHEMWCEKGDIYMCMQEYEKAAECYREALSIFGHHALYELRLRECEEKCQ